MKKLLLLVIVLSCLTSDAQPGTKVFLFEIDEKDGKIGHLNLQNISNNEGYDNQPSFYEDDTILFSATRNGQTDIAKHDIPSAKISWLTDTPYGSEYSSLRIPDSDDISAIRLDASVLHGLPDNINDKAWLYEGRLIFPYGKSIAGFNPKPEEKPGTPHIFRKMEINSISRMAVGPNGKQMAIVSQESPAEIVQKQVDSYNAGDLDAFVNCYSKNVVVRNFPNDTLYVGHQKMRENYGSLSPDKKVYDVEVVKRIVIGNKVIDHEKVAGNGKIQMQVALYEVDNGKISSMTFIFDEKNAPDPQAIVQEQLDAYNKRDIEGFLSTYTDEVELYNFPAEKRSEGKVEMRKGYTGFFESTPDLQCEIKNRIVIANKVIDEEYITANGSNFSAVAVYEVENGKIAKVTFLR